MKFILYLFVLPFFFIGCGSNEQKQETNKVDLDSARHNILVAINNFNSAYIKKDWNAMKNLLSGTVHMFGMDSSSIINSTADFEKQLNLEWDKYDQEKIGALVAFERRVRTRALGLLLGLSVGSAGVLALGQGCLSTGQ